MGGLGAAAVAEAARRVQAALAGSYGEEKDGLSGGGADGGGASFWELPRLVGLSWGGGAGEGGEGKAWDVQGTQEDDDG